MAIGPAMGGLIIGLASWPWVFLINVPVGLIAGTAAIGYIPASPPVLKNQRFDLAGAILMFITLVVFSLGMTMGQKIGFSQPVILGLLIGAGCGFAAFLLVEFQTDHPMVNLGLFRNALFSINLIMGFLVFVLVACLFIIPFFLELVQGYNIETTGMLMIAVPVAMGLISPLAGSFSDRFGPRGITLLGLVVTSAGCLAIATFHQNMSIWGYIIRVLPLGLGLGIFQSPNNSAVMGQAPREHLGMASGLLALSRTLGQTTGVPLVGVIFTAAILAAAPGVDPTQPETLDPQILLAGITGSFRLAGVATLAATVLGGLALYLSRRQKNQQVRQGEKTAP